MKISCVSNEKMPQLYFVSLYSNVLFCYETNMPKSLMCFFVTKIIKYKQPIWQRPVFCKLKTPTLKRKTRGKRSERARRESKGREKRQREKGELEGREKGER